MGWCFGDRAAASYTFRANKIEGVVLEKAVGSSVHYGIFLETIGENNLLAGTTFTLLAPFIDVPATA
jgi:hypothetical protein